MSKFNKIMGREKGSPKEILERMKLAYGVSSNVELSKLIKTPVSTMSNWISRDSVPFRYVYDCAQATGKDVDWLISGELANASCDGVGSAKFTADESIYGQILQSGGQQLLQRLLTAYGFTMQKQLGDLLGLSSGTISTWIRRDHFPGDVVVACALDTGVDLRWLATGENSKIGGTTPDAELPPNLILVQRQSLHNGRLELKGKTVIDTAIIPNATSDCELITKDSVTWCVNIKEDTLINGLCLLDIDGVLDIYNVARLPGGKIKVNATLGAEFECSSEDVTCRGVVIKTIN